MKKELSRLLILVCSVAMELAGLTFAQDIPPLVQGSTPAEKFNMALPHKKVFVTSRSFSGDFRGLYGAEMFCQDLAREAGLKGTFKPWLNGGRRGNPASSSYFYQSPFPYVRVDGVKVANNFREIATSPYKLRAPISIDEKGNFVATTNVIRVWTGGYVMTNSSGKFVWLGGSTCAGWWVDREMGPNPLPNGVAGDLSKNTNMEWSASVELGCNWSARLYCFEQ